MKSVWLACEDYGYDDGWAILGVYSTKAKAEHHLAAFPIVIRRYADGERAAYEPAWVVEVASHMEFIEPHESLAKAILEADKRDNLFVEEWLVDEVPE